MTPDRTTHPPQQDPPHDAFVERVIKPETASLSERHIALGALLVVRLLDRWCPAEQDPERRRAFAQQAEETIRHLGNAPEPTEAARLRAIAEALLEPDGEESRRSAAAAVRAHATQLEQALRLDEAGDLLETMLHAGSLALEPEIAAPLYLVHGRVCRKASAFEEALSAYGKAQTLAKVIGDESMTLASQLGQAAVIWRRGNLPEAKRRLLNIGDEAQAAGEETMCAAAKHELAVVLDEMGQLGDAICNMFSAYEMYPDRENKLFALHDVAVMLMRLGDYESANQGLRVVQSTCAWEGTRSLASVGLMELAARRGDEVGFRNWQRINAKREAIMSDELLATYHLRHATGEARFGTNDARDQAFGQAEAIARQAGLHGLEFEIERVREELRSESHHETVPPPDPDSPDWEATRAVAHSIRSLSFESA